METHDKKGKCTSYVLILVFVILTVSIVIAGCFYHRNYEVHYRVELVVVRGFVQEPVMAVAYFTSVYLGLKLKLRVLARHVFKAARRVFGIPDFRLYALADGIKHFLFNRSKGLRIALPPPKPRFVQRLLFDP